MMCLSDNKLAICRPLITGISILVIQTSKSKESFSAINFSELLNAFTTSTPSIYSHKSFKYCNTKSSSSNNIHRSIILLILFLRKQHKYGLPLLYSTYNDPDTNALTVFPNC